MSRPKSDPLEEVKVGREGNEVASLDTPPPSTKQVAADLVAKAKVLFPDGLPDDSPFATLAKDSMLQEANRVGMNYGAFMSDAELRLVLEAHRHAASAPRGKPLPKQPPVPMHEPPKVELKNVPASKTNAWTVANTEPKNVSLSGQMVVMSPGKRIELRHYGADKLNSMVQQGIKLVPVAAEPAKR